MPSPTGRRTPASDSSSERLKAARGSGDGVAERAGQRRPQATWGHPPEGYLGGAQEGGERRQRLRQPGQRPVTIEPLTNPPPGLRRPVDGEPGLEVHVANLEPLL